MSVEIDHQRAVRAFAPATVANVACGFDVLGFAIEGPGDVVTARRTATPGVTIEAVTGDGGVLPREAARNTAGVAASALLRALGAGGAGVALGVEKRMPLRSGMGSSAASAVAAAVATAGLLGVEAPRELLLACALEAEAVACGSAHADNAAASLYGGFVLVRAGKEGPDVVTLPVPEGLSVALVRPHTAVDTGAARAALGDRIALADAVTQWGNLAGLVAGLYRGDRALIERCLVDVVAEPKRASQVPGFAAAREAAREAGALGASLSGSGPSIFALCRDRAGAERAADAMRAAVARATGLTVDRLTSPVGAPGARILES